MLYYFSGTGNSEYIARIAASRLDCALSSIINPTPFDDDSLGLVFPVYAWGIPAVVEHFIHHALPSLTKGKNVNYVWCILTHGDDMGYADTVLRKHLAAVGITLNAAFSLSMPNTYVCLPGFDVDSEELTTSKISDSAAKTEQICTIVARREAHTDVVRGAFPRFKTYIIRPLFNKFLVTDKYFHVREKACTRCATCVKQCPLQNIALKDDNITWNGNCTGCLRCYHACPTNAIQFGKFTQGKGQKKCPPCSRRMDTR